MKFWDDTNAHKKRGKKTSKRNEAANIRFSFEAPAGDSFLV